MGNPRNLIVCCDGTNNEFGSNNTNVVRLIQVLDRDPEKQLVYYDPGVGTMPEPGYVTPFGKWISKVFGLAFGAGLEGKIGGAYAFLIDHYRPGDRIYLFGFSRGSYTVRALAGVLHQFGLLPPGSKNLIPYALRYAKAVNQLRRKQKTGRGNQVARNKYWKVCADFRNTFAQIHREHGQSTRKVKIHFLGIWDTVSTVGWVWEPVHYPYTSTNKDVVTIRHAIALDEHRAFFPQNRWANPLEGQDFRELWFAGVHSDVGGGYPEESGRMWRSPFLWMLGEGRRAGLHVRTKKVKSILKPALHEGSRTKRLPWIASWGDREHESLDWRWWLAEFFPKVRWYPELKQNLPYINLFRRRDVQDGAELHRSLLRRIRSHHLGYSPPNLSRAFLAHVRALKEIPKTLPYKAAP